VGPSESAGVSSTNDSRPHFLTIDFRGEVVYKEARLSPGTAQSRDSKPDARKPHASN